MVHRATETDPPLPPPHKLLIDMSVWLDLAKEHRQQPLVDVFDTLWSGGYVSFIVPRLSPRPRRHVTAKPPSKPCFPYLENFGLDDLSRARFVRFSSEARTSGRVEGRRARTGRSATNAKQFRICR